MVVQPVPLDEPLPVAGRSLWQDAWIRLRRNRAAVASMVVLVALALDRHLRADGLAAPLRPRLSAVRAGAGEPRGLSRAPTPSCRPSSASSTRTRLDADAPVLDGGEITVGVRSDEPIDPRVLRYFERSDLFSNPRLDLAEDGLSGTLAVNVERLHFYFGTDAIGRDLAARIMIGVRISLAIGILASIMALLLGVSYGAVSGYLGGRVDNVMMRIVDILYSLPFIFFVILMVVFFGRSLVIIFIAIGFTEWLDMARIVRGQTLSLKRQEFVQAAEALGATKAGILTRHIIPNTLGPVVVFVTLLVPKAILLESLLSFLGLGVQDPLTSLGLLISEGAANMRGALWLLIWPALTLTLILFALNFLGDGLRDSLDPKDR